MHLLAINVDLLEGLCEPNDTIFEPFRGGFEKNCRIKKSPK